jgi:hypothetical protein
MLSLGRTSRFLSRWTLLAFLICIPFLVTLLSRSKTPSVNTLVISLASSSLRFDQELPLTLLSLEQQTVQPSEVLIFLPEEEKAELQQLLKRSKGLQRPFVKEVCRFFFVRDLGPASKLFVRCSRNRGAHSVVACLL